MQPGIPTKGLSGRQLRMVSHVLRVVSPMPSKNNPTPSIVVVCSSGTITLRLHWRKSMPGMDGLLASPDHVGPHQTELRAPLPLNRHLSHRHPNHLCPGHWQMGDVQGVASELYSVRLGTQRLQYCKVICSKLDGKLWQFSPGKSYWFRASQEGRCSSIHLLGCLGEVLYVTLRRRAKTRSLNSSDSHTARATGAFTTRLARKVETKIIKQVVF